MCVLSSFFVVVINHIVTLHERDFYVEDYDHGRHEEVKNDNDVIACGKLTFGHLRVTIFSLVERPFFPPKL